MSISRRMDKKAVVHIHNGILLSHWKEYIWISSNEVDETGAYYTEWKKSKKNTHIVHWHIYMEFRKMVMITLYVRQQKRHRYIEQSFGLCGRRWGRDDLREYHWNIYIIICEIDRQSRFDAWDRVLRPGALEWPRGMGWGGRWEGVQDGIHKQLFMYHLHCIYSRSHSIYIRLSNLEMI